MKLNHLSTGQKLATVSVILLASLFIQALRGPRIQAAHLKTSAAANKAYVTGDEMPAAHFVIASSEEENWSEICAIVKTKDPFAIAAAVQKGKAIPIEKGTTLRFLNVGIPSGLVKVMVQEGKFSGKTCYVPEYYFTGKHLSK